MASSERGTKRICPTTGRKFYDLNRDPVVSPYTGQVVPISALTPFSQGAAPALSRKVTVDEDEPETEGAELVSLDEVESEEAEADSDNGTSSDEELIVEDDAATSNDDTLIEDEDEDSASDLIDVEDEDDD